MDYKSILTDIKNMELKSVYVFYGQENYLRDFVIKEIKKKYIDTSFETLNYIYLDGKEITVDDIINACETLPFMADRKFVIVEDGPYFTSGKSGNDDEKLSEYVQNLSQYTTLIFVVNDEKIDSRKKIIKNIKKVGSIVEFVKIKDSDLDKWITKIFKKYNKAISLKDVGYFIESCGYSEYNSTKTLYDVQNEVIKLCNYIGDRTDVNRKDVEKVISKSLQNNIFGLLDGIGQKKPSHSLSLFNEMLLDNEAPQKILFMIIKQLRLLYMAKLLEDKGYPKNNIISKLKVHPYAGKKIVDQSKNFNGDELKKILESSIKTDRDIKKGNIDIKLAIERLIIEFAQ